MFLLTHGEGYNRYHRLFSLSESQRVGMIECVFECAFVHVRPCVGVFVHICVCVCVMPECVRVYAYVCVGVCVCGACLLTAR